MPDTAAPRHSVYKPASKILSHSDLNLCYNMVMTTRNQPEAPAQEVGEDTNTDVTSTVTNGIKMGQRVYTKDQIRKFRVKHEATANALEAERDNLITVIVSHGTDSKTREALEEAARNLVAVHEMALTSRRNAQVYAKKLESAA